MVIFDYLNFKKNVIKKTAKILVRTLAEEPSHFRFSAQLKNRHTGLCKVLLAFQPQAYSDIFKKIVSRLIASD
jgi:hypothetical protein